MTYVVTHSNGNVFASIPEAGHVNITGVPGDATTGVVLIGQNYQNYGQLLANNFLRLLENQANSTAPLYPVEGQLWWNTTTKVLSFYDGSKFKPCVAMSAAASAPVSPIEGDQWWDSSAKQLKTYNGSTWLVVGPIYTAAQGITGAFAANVTDSNASVHVVSLVQTQGNTAAIVSNDSAFTLATPINGISVVNTGINLAATAKMTGTATNSDALGSALAASYVRNDIASQSPINGSLVIQGIGGLTVGNHGNVTITSDTSFNQHLTASQGNLTLTAGSTILNLVANGDILLSGNATTNMGVATKIYVDNSIQTANTVMTSYVNTGIQNLVAGATLSTLNALSNAVGNDPAFYNNIGMTVGFKANSTNPTFNGTISPFANASVNIGSISNTFANVYAQTFHGAYADLAEMYVADEHYNVGTVVVFGGEKEITVSDELCDTRVAGVVSESPGYLLNASCENGTPVALTGKVPCRVIGKIKKGDVLVNSHVAGVAEAFNIMACKFYPGIAIGKSLEDKLDDGIGYVIVSVGRF